MSNSLWPHGLYPTRLLCSWHFPGKNSGVGCHFFLQGILPTQGLNPSLLHCTQVLYCRATWQVCNSLPWGPCPSTLMLNQTAHKETPWPAHLWMAAAKKKLTQLLPKTVKPGDVLQDLWPFYFTYSPPPPLCSIKEISIQTPERWSSRTLLHRLPGRLTLW